MWDMKYRDEKGKERYKVQRAQFVASTLRAVQRRRDAREEGLKPPCRIQIEAEGKEV